MENHHKVAKYLLRLLLCGSPTNGRPPLTAIYPLNAQHSTHAEDKVEPSQDLTWLEGVHYAYFVMATRRTHLSYFAIDAIWCVLTRSTQKSPDTSTLLFREGAS